MRYEKFITNLLVETNGYSVLPLHYMEIQEESNLFEDYAYGSEKRQAKVYVQHLYYIADHQMLFLQSSEFRQRISLLMVDASRDIVHHELPQILQIVIDIFETGL